MAITYIGAGSWDEGTNLTSVTPTINGSAQENDFMIAYCHNSQNAAAKTWDDDGGGGNGWTRLDYNRTTSGRDRETAIYYKKHSGTESDPTFTIGGSGSHSSGVIETFRGVDATNPFDVTYSTASHFTAGSNNSLPTNDSITTVTDGAWVVINHMATHDDITVAGAPTGYTVRANLVGSNKDHRQSIVATKEIVTAGAESPGAWTHTASPTNVQEYHLYTLALKPSGQDLRIDQWGITFTEPSGGGGTRSMRQLIGHGQGTRT